MSAKNKTYDVVITWVDDQFDGYSETLRAYASDGRDTNPNRTRDNLETLRYCLRSLEQFLPELGRVFLVTCRPQVPAWLNLDCPRLTVVHHDEIMQAENLPTFNSFAIVSHLHLINGLSEDFLYFEDDALLLREGLIAGMHRGGQQLALFGAQMTTPLARLDADAASPWNLALGHADQQLNARFGAKPRAHAIHGPLLFSRVRLAEMVAEFADDYAHTRASRFRAAGNVPTEYIYPHYLVETGAAVAATRAEARKIEGYASLENLSLWSWAQLKMLDLRRPITATLNDSFEHNPNPRVERMVRKWLARRYPRKSGFEV